MMRRSGDSWLISDIHLDSAISEVATRRSEFAAILKNERIDAMIWTAPEGVAAHEPDEPDRRLYAAHRGRRLCRHLGRGFAGRLAIAPKSAGPGASDSLWCGSLLPSARRKLVMDRNTGRCCRQRA